MKKLMVVSRADKIGKYYCDELRDFFEDRIQIDYIVDDDPEISKISSYEMILITTNSIIKKIIHLVDENSKILRVLKNMDPEGVERLNRIPYGAEALVVNVGPKMASESIYLIYACGRHDLELYPYYPGIDGYKKLEYIITQGEPDIVPDYGGEVIDILNTTIDNKIFLEIISFFNLDRKELLDKLMERNSYRDDEGDGISFVINERYMLENIINVLFENLNEGVLIYNDMGIVTSSSSSAQSILNKATHNISGRKITDLIPVGDYDVMGNDAMETVVKIGDIPVICNIMPKMTLGSNDYGLVILKKYTDTEMKMHMYKKELMDKGHRSKYDIDDIVGSSAEMKKQKDIAVRMAKSDSTVLIIGESGTGKELFAHVIHNNSRRRKEQFVAVNCSAIPESLLESELFGYSDGAFTGAKKGGKKGLFEIANGGTLFLDEIGEMPLHLQNRLLRVLQEKEIMRVGSNSIIKIDVRIIAATNVDLMKQARAGKFRKDLFYRISVLPLVVPPLRKRGNDVLEIFDRIASEKGDKIELSEEVKKFFVEYSWEGNVREVRNCVEYLINLGKDIVKLDDLPESMKLASLLDGNEMGLQDDVVGEVTEGANIRENVDIDMEILKILYEKNSRNMKIGRKQLSEELRRVGIFLGEQEVRNKLLLLQKKGFVAIGKGRGGTKITAAGVGKLNQ
ncbi:Transcriptional regulator containing PAS, AAA-type ATPase, and DNA-binding Fis domains [Dethiosulfatibacter aminovorans DSM 17477]|uniref:Transcriptional regulator containing PAS, AAA-type ATPase, and DNA-binding Fis domains n=1 Tax=Dethiosulfatibacter aminovorans DSM 17477 TaxID=1121476 RepID=A0A1M6F9G1_9FIRM|nr:sigma 54-interacting transcriptional regulator [Dethiosulfatibacter aminovorans]SHI94286.1 Transcriptional regulator containing PAS, AAA-type ATPase, and DNA-binding Fis domains [Dethiosulfatibacter aminovorans DSM 17477]